MKMEGLTLVEYMQSDKSNDQWGNWGKAGGAGGKGIL